MDKKAAKKIVATQVALGTIRHIDTLATTPTLETNTRYVIEQNRLAVEALGLNGIYLGVIGKLLEPHHHELIVSYALKPALYGG